MEIVFFFVICLVVGFVILVIILIEEFLLVLSGFNNFKILFERKNKIISVGNEM